MRIYKSPEIEIEELSTEDIVLTSSGGTTGGGDVDVGPGGLPVQPLSAGDMTSSTGVDYGAGGMSFGDVTGNF